MSNRSSFNIAAIGFVGLLTIVFITVKVTGNTDWSWLWVLSPIWITAILLVVISVIVVCVMGLVCWLEK